jgi:CRISPR-associated protein Cmr1
VVTPLFLGGADPEHTVELRAPSVKGALRFWWRALAWSRMDGNLKAIQDEEARLFGSSAAEDGNSSAGGQASFVIRTLRCDAPRILKKGEVLGVGPGARYLGYGLMETFDSRPRNTKAGQLLRPCVSSPWSFSIELASREPLDASVLNAVKLLGLLGGIGSRTRRGYGGLSLVSLSGDVEPWSGPKRPAEYASAVRSTVAGTSLSSGEPPYSAFTSLSRIIVVDQKAEALALLDHIGRQIQRYRSWGRNGVVNGEPSEKNFQDDHDWFRSRKNFGHTHPRRAIFGLPHNYSRDLGIISKKFDRRASPLLVHIHQLESGSYVAVLSIVRSRFLADDDEIWVWQGRPERPGRDPRRIPRAELRVSRPNWQVLDAVVDGTSPTLNEPYFPKRQQIFP